MKLVSAGSALLFLSFISCAAHEPQVIGEKVTLYLEKTDAEKVLFYCSLNEYSGQELIQFMGHWQVTLPAERAFRYFYRVDGMIYLPPCQIKEKDDFGSENCVFEPEM